MFVLTFLALFIVHFVRASIVISEFTMRRIAESPKGPLLAISAIVGGVAAVVKTLQ
jgi:hypothetical protein